jgi:hypothetical protein
MVAHPLSPVIENRWMDLINQRTIGHTDEVKCEESEHYLLGQSFPETLVIHIDSEVL